MKKITNFVLFGLLVTTHVSANQWSYSGVIDGFYTAHSSAVPSTKSYPFVYAYPDSNRIQFNQALFEVQYHSDIFYSRLGIQAGRYVDENYAAEPVFSRSLYSAFIGKKLTETVTLEGGIFPSHIGFESAIGPDNWTLSRSILADNSPYFESGLKLLYAPNDTWTLTGLLLNGWQRISDPQGLAIGTQIQWKASPDLLLNSSAFIGQIEQEGNESKTRYFHDFFAVMTLSEQLSMATVADIGLENSSSGWSTWSGAAVLGQWKQLPTRRWGARLKFFSDPEACVTRGISSLWSSSINMDWDLFPNMMWRNEIKQTWGTSESDLQFSTALALQFKGDLL